MITYYRLKGRDIWHFHKGCHYIKAAFEANRVFDAAHDFKPRSGKFCNECIAKTDTAP